MATPIPEAVPVGTIGTSTVPTSPLNLEQIRSQSYIVQAITGAVHVLSQDSRSLPLKLAILKDKAMQGKQQVQIWEFANPVDGVIYWVFYFVGPKYELLLQTLQQFTAGESKLPAEHDGSFSITMTSALTYRVT